MLDYARTDVSEGIDVNRTSSSKEYIIYHDWFFLNYRLKLQPNVCNTCYDLLMMSINLSNIANLNSKYSDYCCIISLISKNEAINVMQNANFTKKMQKMITLSLPCHNGIRWFFDISQVCKI